MTDYLSRETDFDDPRVASAFDELSFWSARFGSLLFDHLELIPGLNVLDVACGTGFPLLELAQVHGDTCRFTGVDIWAPALRRAAAKLTVHDLPHVHLLRADGVRLPFPGVSLWFTG